MRPEEGEGHEGAAGRAAVWVAGLVWGLPLLRFTLAALLVGVANLLT